MKMKLNSATLYYGASRKGVSAKGEGIVYPEFDTENWETSLVDALAVLSSVSGGFTMEVRELHIFPEMVVARGAGFNMRWGNFEVYNMLPGETVDSYLERYVEHDALAVKLCPLFAVYSNTVNAHVSPRSTHVVSTAQRKRIDV